MIVLDASAALAGLTRAGAARNAMASERLHAPHLIDTELASALRRQLAAGRVDPGAAHRVLAVWQRVGLARHPTVSMLGRVWELRENVTAYDAAYVALAELLGCPLLTADARIAGAPGLRCPVTTVIG
jgi:predicted nucleic acid-binding protein